MSLRTDGSVGRVHGLSAIAAAAGAFTPLSVAGCQLWLRADVGTVSSWTDQSGNANHFTQATGARQPTIVSSSINGQPAYRFDATSSQYVTGPSFSALTACDFFIVAKMDLDPPSPVQNNATWKFGANGPDYYCYNDGNIYCGIGSTTRQSVGSNGGNGTAAHILEVISTSTEFTFLRDTTQLYTTATNTVGWEAAGSLLGASCTTGVSPTEYAKGNIAEVILYSAKLSTSDRSSVKNYLKTRYGTP